MRKEDLRLLVRAYQEYYKDYNISSKQIIEYLSSLLQGIKPILVQDGAEIVEIPSVILISSEAGVCLVRVVNDELLQRSYYQVAMFTTRSSSIENLITLFKEVEERLKHSPKLDVVMESVHPRLIKFAEKRLKNLDYTINYSATLRHFSVHI